MKFIKHKNMRDVCFEIMEKKEDLINNMIFLKGLWYNLRGLYFDPKPFPIGSGNQLAIEIIKISSEALITGEWEFFDELESAQASLQTEQC